MSHTDRGVLVRLRSEGRSAVMMAVPQSLREVLLLRAGDMLMVRVEDGELRARKVDLARAFGEPGGEPAGSDDTK